MKRIFIKKAIRFLTLSVAAFTILSCVGVVLYKWINPPITPLMIMRLFEGAGKIEKNWQNYEDISPNIFKACIAAEDARFLRHEGIDWKAVEAAKRYNKIYNGKKIRGASTITMQTAKNVFLWNGKNFVRKGLEAYFTVLIEAVWGKKRILEVYVNVVEWGNGIYGVEAASQKYFKKSASKLTKREAALLAATLPNPRRFFPDKPSKYIKNRADKIQNRMAAIALPRTSSGKK